MTFGRRKVPFSAMGGAMPQPVADADGRRRVPGAGSRDGPRGALLRKLGIAPGDPANLIPSEQDHANRITASRLAEEERRGEVDTALLRRHGSGRVRPYFVFGDGVWQGPHGPFLARTMDLLPYDGWNCLYLAADHESALLVDAPVHPGRSLAPVDARIGEELDRFAARFAELHAADGGDSDAFGAFAVAKARLRQEIVDYAGQLKPLLIELIADLWRQAAAGPAEPGRD